MTVWAAITPAGFMKTYLLAGRKPPSSGERRCHKECVVSHSICHGHYFASMSKRQDCLQLHFSLVLNTPRTSGVERSIIAGEGDFIYSCPRLLTSLEISFF